LFTLIDTAGAFPGLEAEKGGQKGRQLPENLKIIVSCPPRNLKENVYAQSTGCLICYYYRAKVASGGALGIAIGDSRYSMFGKNTWYSSASLLNLCSSILWRSWDTYKEASSRSLKLTATDMKGF